MIELTYYALLGLEPSAMTEEVELAYKRAAIAYHPDKRPGDALAGKLFAAMARARQVLCNPAERARYDSFLARRATPSAGPSAAGPSAATAGTGDRLDAHNQSAIAAIAEAAGLSRHLVEALRAGLGGLRDTAIEWVIGEFASKHRIKRGGK